jgi:hypothetical protein
MPSVWPLHSGLALGPLPSAVPCARLHTKHVLYEWRLPALSETVELLVAESVTNAVKASGLVPGPLVAPVRLALSSDYRRVLIEVWDASPQPPVPKA